MTAATGDAEDRRTALALAPVSRETEDRLSVYVDRLRVWQRVKNLVAPSTLDRIWTRHIADSAQLIAIAPDALRWVDLGSGAGFPGVVVAILLATRPHACVDLIESNARKCAFLRDVVRLTGAPARVHAGRIERIVPTLGAVDVVTSRALASLPAVIALSQMLLDCGATGLFLTGEDVADSGAGQMVSRYAIDRIPSRTRAAAWVTRVKARGSTDQRA